MKTVLITDPKVVSTIIEAANLKSDGLIVTNNVTIGKEGLRYATLKNLGVSATDGKKGTLLITEIGEGNELFNGIIGTIYKLRGSNYASLVAEQFSITCTKAYSMFENIAGNNAKVGKCTYKGKLYLGVSMASSPYHDMFFSGFYSVSCIFLSVPDSEVTWI